MSSQALLQGSQPPVHSLKPLLSVQDHRTRGGKSAHSVENPAVESGSGAVNGRTSAGVAKGSEA